MFKLFGLCLFLKICSLSSVCLDLCPFSNHHFDLVKREFKLFVKRVGLHEFLIRSQLALALFKSLLHHHLLLLKVPYLLNFLVLNTENGFLSFLDLLLKTFSFSFKLLRMLESFHCKSLRVNLHVLKIHIVQVRRLLLLFVSLLKSTIGFSQDKLLSLFLPQGRFAVLFISL